MLCHSGVHTFVASLWLGSLVFDHTGVFYILTLCQVHSDKDFSYSVSCLFMQLFSWVFIDLFLFICLFLLHSWKLIYHCWHYFSRAWSLVIFTYAGTLNVSFALFLIVLGFQVLLTLRSLICLELVFVYGERHCSSFILPCVDSLANNICWGGYLLKCAFFFFWFCKIILLLSGFITGSPGLPLVCLCFSTIIMMLFVFFLR